jgi:membrane-associated phospholipid phosphatase
MLLYVAAFTLLLLWNAPVVTAWPFLLAANILAALLTRLVARAPAGTPFMRFVGPAYPLLLVGGYYTALGVITLDVALVHDQTVLRWEEALFGGQPSVTWHQTSPNTLLSWVMHLCYGAYYLVVSGIPIYFWLRRSAEAYARVAFHIALAFYACYLIFGLYPVAGPRYFFGVASDGGADVLAARVVHGLLEGGSAYGTAFPSSHVAATWAAALAAWREAPRLALALSPVAVGLALGTVYGQFHYAVDAIAGAIVGVVVLATADPIYRLLKPNQRVTKSVGSMPERTRPPDRRGW